MIERLRNSYVEKLVELPLEKKKGNLGGLLCLDESEMFGLLHLEATLVAILSPLKLKLWNAVASFNLGLVASCCEQIYQRHCRLLGY